MSSNTVSAFQRTAVSSASYAPYTASTAALDAALDGLATISERQCQVVECRFFADMSIEETAQALQLSPATVKRDWAMASAWLYREIQGADLD
jgi:DNA-directed RNA polymerase specialized sigma24 family protein